MGRFRIIWVVSFCDILFFTERETKMLRKLFGKKVIAIACTFALVLSLMTGISFVSVNAEDSIILTTDKEVYDNADPIMVTAHCDLSQYPEAWVGIYKKGETPNTKRSDGTTVISYYWYALKAETNQAWGCTNVSNGDNVPINILENGYWNAGFPDCSHNNEYTLYLFTNGTDYTPLAQVDITYDSGSIELEKTKIKVGTPINATIKSIFAGGAEKPWYGVYTSEDLDKKGLGGYFYWSYLNDNETNIDINTVVGENLSPGKYTIVLFVDNNYGVDDSVEFEVVEEEPTTEAPTTEAPTTEETTPEVTTPVETTQNPYAELTFTDITNNQNPEFDQKLKGSQYAINTGSTFDSLQVCQYQNVGFGELYIAGTWSAAGLTATLNGFTDGIEIEGAGLHIGSAADSLTKRYNVIDVSTTDGSSGQIIIYCPEIPEEVTTTPEVTTPEVTTPEVTSEPVVTTTPEVTTEPVETTTEDVTTTPEETTPEVTTVPGESTEPVETTTEGPKKPTAPTVVVRPDKTKPYYFAWNMPQDAESFNVYVNGEKVAATTVPTYDASEYFAKAAEGKYVVGVTSVKGDLESDMTTIEITVEKPIETTAEEPTVIPEEPTTIPVVTTKAPVVTTKKTTPTTKKVVKAPGKTKVKKAIKKKKSPKKIKITLKKIKGAKGYQVAVYKNKKKAKKNKKAIKKKYSTKAKFTVKSKKFKKTKKLFVRARAYALDGKKKVFGKWSKVKKVKNK